MKKTAGYYWFIEPRDAATNKILSECLPPENVKAEIKCSDGVHRNLWECPHSTVTMFCSSASDSAFAVKFRVFHRAGLHGQIHPWKFERRRNAEPPREPQSVEDLGAGV